MVGKVEPGLGYGTRGWKARQLAAKRKLNVGKTPKDREQIRAIRKAHKMGLASGSDGQEMSRDEMISALKESGVRVHPNSKDETLREKLKAVGDGADNERE